jgi:hypothetical protein
MSARPVQVRQAQGEPTERLLFDLSGGLTCDLEGLGTGARHQKKEKVSLLLFYRTFACPSYITPRDESTVISCPSFKIVVAFSTPTITGIPILSPTTAA